MARTPVYNRMARTGCLVRPLAEHLQKRSDVIHYVILNIITSIYCEWQVLTHTIKLSALFKRDNQDFNVTPLTVAVSYILSKLY